MIDRFVINVRGQKVSKPKFYHDSMVKSKTFWFKESTIKRNFE